MSFRAPSPPSTGYSIIDIRQTNAPLDKHTADPIVDRPPSPPRSTGVSEDAFNDSSLVDTIVNSLNKPLHQKSIPTYILYDKRGLQLFDQITHLDDEYYLTGAELDILQTRSEEITAHLQENSVLFELGAGALRKTQVILRAIEKRKIRVTYYALDLDQHELDRSLASLGEFEYVQLYGLLGTYDQGIPWITQQFTGNKTQKNFLWMGSSIGNQNRLESAMFLRKIQRMCMEPGDFFLIGFDKRNEPAKIELAYDDSHGVTREFIMNGLDHVNHIMGQADFIDRRMFDYHSIYQEKQGRHLSHYRALQDVTIRYKETEIKVQKDELIHVEHSYKYSLGEIESILAAADLNLVNYWLDSKDQYRLVMAQNRPFSFGRNLEQVNAVLYPSKELFDQEPIACHHCNEGQFEHDEAQDEQEKDTHWPSHVLPSLREWQELWKSWDLVTQHMIDHKKMLFERPIALRHPFIFYLGHIPGFLDIQLSRNQVDKELGDTDLTEPKHFADIFERGIDPDMDDPTQCHPHSEVPKCEADWPSVESILAYQSSVRQRLERLLLFWESEAFKSQSTTWMDSRRREARIVWMCFEHEAMHLETLLYMLIQSPNIQPPKNVATPSWKLFAHQQQPLKPLAEAAFLKIPSGSVVLGQPYSESHDYQTTTSSDLIRFGWDNESPARQVEVDEFEIQTRPVTNGEYHAYLQETGLNVMPASWSRDKDNNLFVKTVFGPCPFAHAQHWPIQLSYNEAKSYATHKGARLPTEPELVRFRQLASSMSDWNTKWANIGFDNWSPTDVTNDQLHNLGDVWEWTETIWDAHDGFESSEIYPGYSADFFDGKHRVVLGGSWATHPRIAERTTFRNWYQSGYPYVFSGFRLCH